MSTSTILWSFAITCAALATLMYLLYRHRMCKVSLGTVSLGLQDCASPSTVVARLEGSRIPAEMQLLYFIQYGPQFKEDLRKLKHLSYYFIIRSHIQHLEFSRAVASATPPADLNTDVTKDVEFWKKIGSHLSSETLSEDDFKALKDDLIFERLDENDKAGIEEELSSLIMPVDPNQDRGIEIS